MGKNKSKKQPRTEFQKFKSTMDRLDYKLAVGEENRKRRK